MPTKIIGPAGSLLDRKNDPRVMNETEVINVSNSFDNHVGYQGSSDINGERQYLVWSELESVVESVSDKGHGRAVLFFFGFNRSNLRYGVAVVAFNNANLEYDEVHGPTHHLVDNSLNEVGATWSQWQQHYQDNVWFWRNSRWEKGNVNDARCVVLPYELEVRQLYRDNEPFYRGKTPYIALNSIAMEHRAGDSHYDGGNQGYRHGLCLYMATKQVFGWNDMLDNENSTVVYRFKGADFGNLCPPSCLRYTIPVVITP
jgi:hypothetical protein